jgi:hypothetical protein
MTPKDQPKHDQIGFNPSLAQSQKHSLRAITKNNTYVIARHNYTQRHK